MRVASAALGTGLQQLDGVLSRHAEALAIREEHRARERELASAHELQHLQDIVRQARGFAAEQAMADAQTRVEAMRRELLTGAETATMRNMLADVFNQRAEVARHEMEAHAEREKFAARLDLSMQRQALAQDDAIRAVTPLGFETNVQTAFDEIDAQAALTGQTPEAAEAAKRQLLRSLRLAQLERSGTSVPEDAADAILDSDLASVGGWEGGAAGQVRFHGVILDDALLEEADQPSLTNASLLRLKPPTSNEPLASAGQNKASPAPKVQTINRVRYQSWGGDIEAIRPTIEKTPAVLNAMRMGILIVVVKDSVAEFKSYIQSRTPPGPAEGWPVGTKWTDLPALYDPGQAMLIVSSSTKVGTSSYDKILHEVGHSIDGIYGGLSTRPEFRTAYTADLHRLAKMPVPKYYNTNDARGRRETFSEVFAMMQSRRQWAKANLPNLFAYMEARGY